VPIVAGDGSWVVAPEPGGARLADLEGLRVVRFWGSDRNAASREFSDRFAERYGSQADHAEALTYDAAMLVLDAVRWGAVWSREFRDYLLSLGNQEPPFEGLAGSYRFRHGRPEFRELEMAIVKSGQVVRERRREVPR
jgi:ABC-type branched-subunit amino acid transport system substrate-binding protein